MFGDRQPGIQHSPSGSDRKYFPKIEPDEVRRKMRLDYIRMKNDKAAKLQDGLQLLLAHSQVDQVDIKALLQEAADFIHKYFSIRTCTIGLKCKKDGLFRYVVKAGLRDEPWKQHQTLSYTVDDFQSFEQYSGYEISPFTRVYLEEDNPMTQEERKAYNRPSMLDLKRRAPDDNLEADYVDTLIYGRGEDLLGWIEISGTIGGKMPDPLTVKSVETIAHILASALLCPGAKMPEGF